MFSYKFTNHWVRIIIWWTPNNNQRIKYLLTTGISRARACVTNYWYVHIKVMAVAFKSNSLLNVYMRALKRTTNTVCSSRQPIVYLLTAAVCTRIFNTNLMESVGPSLLYCPFIPFASSFIGWTIQRCFCTGDTPAIRSKTMRIVIGSQHNTWRQRSITGYTHTNYSIHIVIIQLFLVINKIFILLYSTFTRWNVFFTSNFIGY